MIFSDTEVSENVNVEGGLVKGAAVVGVGIGVLRLRSCSAFREAAAALRMTDFICRKCRAAIGWTAESGRPYANAKQYLAQMRIGITM